MTSDLIHTTKREFNNSTSSVTCGLTLCQNLIIFAAKGIRVTQI